MPICPICGGDSEGLCSSCYDEEQDQTRLAALTEKQLRDIRLAWRSGERPEDYPHLFDD